MGFRRRALGLSLGLVWGLTILLCTWWFILFKKQGEIFGKLNEIYLGYSISWGGSFIGFLWGFVDGFIAGVLIAWLYGVFSKMLYKEKRLT